MCQVQGGANPSTLSHEDRSYGYRKLQGYPSTPSDQSHATIVLEAQHDSWKEGDTGRLEDTNSGVTPLNALLEDLVLSHF